MPEQRGVWQEEFQQLLVKKCSCVCPGGGGSLHPLYNRFINAINMNKNIHVNLDAIKLDKPEKLIAPGLKDDDYHRLSVAYGLAHEQLGKVIRESNINEITPMCNLQNIFSDKYISKDQI